MLNDFREDQRSTFLGILTIKAAGGGEELDVPDLGNSKTEFDGWLMSPPEAKAKNWEDDVVYQALFPNRHSGKAAQVTYDPAGNPVDPYAGAVVQVPESTT